MLIPIVMSFYNPPPPPADKLPFISHPGVLARLLAELGGAASVGDACGRLFMQDPALALLALEAIGQLHPGSQLADMGFEQQVARLEPVTIKSLAIASAAEQLAAPPHSPEALETGWRKALATAHFSRALAEKAGYPGLDEAWLAGLMCWLPRFVRNAGADADAARQQALAALDRLPLRTFLPDVLRYINEPARRLVDAAPLVRLALAAYRQTMNYPAWIPALPHPDTLLLAAPIDRESISEIYLAMGRAIDTLAGENSFRQAGEIARELSRMGRLELVAGGHPQDTAAAVVSLADSLASQDGLGQAIYLHRNPRGGALEGQPLGGRPTPPIAIQPEGSNTAAAWALLTRAPVVVTLDAPADAAVLDLQIIRQAGAEGLAAIPIGADSPVGVLLVCGSRQALSAVTANPLHYARLGELAGRQAQAGSAGPAQTGDNGQLAVKVRRAAHEINNPLGIIKNYLAIMKAKLGEAAPIADELRIMHEELDRIVRIIRGLSQDEAAPGPFIEQADVNALIEDLVKVTHPSWQSKGVRIELHPESGLPAIACDRDKLKQIVLNLLLNALEATPAGGLVRVETSALVNHRQERFVEILVADAGPGIPAELAGRVFSPVESVKGEGHAGLGLSIVKALTESLGGGITFKSHATGTTFQILLPAG
jgi:signal transduction histidine kinase